MDNLDSVDKIQKSEDVKLKQNQIQGIIFYSIVQKLKVLNLDKKDLKDKFDFVPIIEDGNCLYRAIAKGILHDEELYSSIKVILFNYNQKNSQILSSVYSQESVREIRIKILKSEEYGDYGFIYSISYCF